MISNKLSKILKLSDSQYDQNEILFTEENKKVWELSLKSKKEFFKQYGHSVAQEYIDGFYTLKFDERQIPTLEILNISF